MYMGPRGRRHCGCIDLGIHREADTQTFFQAAHVVDGIDRCCCNTHTEFDQGAGVNGKVNQLLTAVRSPVAAIEQDDRPSPGYRSRDVDLVALQVGPVQRGQRITGHEMFGHIASVGTRGRQLAWVARVTADRPELRRAGQVTVADDDLDTMVDSLR